MAEKWKWAPGYRGYYKVSTLGRVKSVSRRMERRQPWGPQIFYSKEKILTPSLSSKGYPKVTLFKDKVGKQFWLNRLVALTWLEKPPTSKHVAMHKDDVPSNCRLSNLAWGTYQENSQDCVDKGRSTRGEDINTAVLTERKVRLIIEKLKVDSSVARRKQLAARAGCSYCAINDILKRRSWKHLSR